MEYSSSLAGYYSAASPVAPTPARRLNLSSRLLPSSHQSRLFTMPRNLPIDHCIRPQRIHYNNPKICWRPFSNMGATPSPGISMVEHFRIASIAFPQAAIESTI